MKRFLASILPFCDVLASYQHITNLLVVDGSRNADSISINPRNAIAELA